MLVIFDPRAIETQILLALDLQQLSGSRTTELNDRNEAQSGHTNSLEKAIAAALEWAEKYHVPKIWIQRHPLLISGSQVRALKCVHHFFQRLSYES